MLCIGYGEIRDGLRHLDPGLRFAPSGLREPYPTNPAAEFTRGPNRMSGVISSTVLQPQ
jgi:hypothetical protein